MKSLADHAHCWLGTVLLEKSVHRLRQTIFLSVKVLFINYICLFPVLLKSGNFG